MKILFVCLGNICRSPMAEGILKNKILEHQLNWNIESAGTESYHVGGPADARAMRTAKKFGIDISSHVARQVTKEDFKKYDLILALATDVHEYLRAVAPDVASLEKLKLFMELKYPGKNLSVPDPWYGTEDGYVPVFEMIDEVCEHFIFSQKQ